MINKPNLRGQCISCAVGRMRFVLPVGLLVAAVSALEFRQDFSGLYESSPCSINATTVGVCKQLPECPSALEGLKRNERPTPCGFNGTIPIVCCEGRPQPNYTKAIEQCVLYSRNECKKVDSFATTAFSRTQPGNTLVTNAGLVNALSRDSQKQKQYFKPVVYGGEPSDPKEFPFMALIGYGEAEDVSWQCGGSLISSFYVLSAAHCTYPSEQIGPARWVRLGDLDTSTDRDDARPQNFEIVQRINHPDYKPPELYSDIALYKLHNSAKFDTYVRPACLYPSYDHWEQKATVAGWGRIEFAGPTSKYLLKANLTLFSTQECANLLKNNSQLPRGIDPLSMICAGEIDGSKDTCQGDSGGPLVIRGFDCMSMHIGVTSFGRQCGLANSPGVYTRTAHFVSWIQSVVWSTPEAIFADLSGSSTFI